MKANMLVLSLFPGIGLLDMAFEEAGFCVVRGPDVLWGGDIKGFHPPTNRFDGIIGGPPCQSYSTYANLARSQGKQVAEDLVPEFVRVVSEAQPCWWLMENVPNIPTVQIEGYRTYRVAWDNRWSGGEQERRRVFQFGSPTGYPLHIEGAALYEPVAEATCLATEGATGRISHSRDTNGNVRASYKPRRDWARFCDLQGLPADFLNDAPFTLEGKYRVVGNGVPLPMGRAIAQAVKEALRVSLRQKDAA